METKKLICPECGSEMEEGFIKDSTYGARLVSSWVKGPPEGSFWKGIKISGKERRTIQSFRCGKRMGTTDLLLCRKADHGGHRLER